MRINSSNAAKLYALVKLLPPTANVSFTVSDGELTVKSGYYVEGFSAKVTVDSSEPMDFTLSQDSASTLLAKTATRNGYEIVTNKFHELECVSPEGWNSRFQTVYNSKDFSPSKWGESYSLKTLSSATLLPMLSPKGVFEMAHGYIYAGQPDSVKGFVGTSRFGHEAPDFLTSVDVLSRASTIFDNDPIALNVTPNHVRLSQGDNYVYGARLLLPNYTLEKSMVHSALNSDVTISVPQEWVEMSLFEVGLFAGYSHSRIVLKDGVLTLFNGENKAHESESQTKGTVDISTYTSSLTKVLALMHISEKPYPLLKCNTAEASPILLSNELLDVLIPSF